MPWEAFIMLPLGDLPSDTCNFMNLLYKAELNLDPSCVIRLSFRREDINVHVRLTPDPNICSLNLHGLQ